MYLALRRARDAPLEVESDERLLERDGVGAHFAGERFDVLDGAPLRVGERGVVARVVGRSHVADDVGKLSVREEPSHRVLVERLQIASVKLLGVREQKLLGYAPAEAGVEHLLEVRLGQRLALAGASEVQV